MSYRNRLFLMFFVSGFCGLVYQIVWARLAMASFGVNAPVLSTVVSVFMLGLFLGTWWGGRVLSNLIRQSKLSALFFYGCAELLTALGALAVPILFNQGHRLLLSLGACDSSTYLIWSGVTVAFSLLPWCVAMGLTFPFAMAFLRQQKAAENQSFSFFYLANVLGAMTGTLSSALFLIELMGFRATLTIAGLMNLTVGLSAWLWSVKTSNQKLNLSKEGTLKFSTRFLEKKSLFPLAILFFSGFCSMGMEMAWVRDFTPVLSNQVYAFAFLLTVYLGSTCGGSWGYRRWIKKDSKISNRLLLWVGAFTGLFPVILNDPRLHSSPFGVLVSLVPFCVCLGALTPKLVDGWSLGDENKAGVAYAVNLWGCLLGPLFATYFLLPFVGAKLCLVLLDAVFAALLFFGKEKAAKFPLPAFVFSLFTLFFASIFFTQSYDGGFPETQRKDFVLRRDYTATVIGSGKGLMKDLRVNGINLTGLSLATKVMAHLPLLMLPRPPQSALDICLGMGNTFRSLSSWNIDTTAVELIPSVPKLFGFYFDDADQILGNSQRRIVVDDGRRYLERTDKLFDVITIDPPPPIETASSSLLYSVEFYQVLQKHLAKGGILQQWFPGGEPLIEEAVARSIWISFPSVKIFRWGSGYFFIASMEPLRTPSVEEAIQRMPLSAQKDITEWGQFGDLKARLFVILANELLNVPRPPDSSWMITDDHPYNEYFLLRRTLTKLFG